ncbi:hypothetical protein EVG20_g970 [Dentipellis fragilis]|uniref:nicotinate phosphoribosyltransferase n=1 Tax=Dentipellis fragilis TaxID=205917 RepID=A0A4Y9ZB37_9AGAM|nr:hypothetical protein EVG20_g970 [Dentipellis fragilis]
MSQDPAPVLPRSILDTDLYKFTMQQAVLQHFPDAKSTYRFTHRDKNVFFTRRSVDIFREAVTHFSELVLTPTERAWLKKACPYFTPTYLDYLSAFRFDPSQVHIRFTSRAHLESDSTSPPASPIEEDPSQASGDPDEEGRVDIEAIGLWVEAILWEVPLMATLSEIYFRTVDTDWTHDGQEDVAYHKAKDLLTAGCVFSEFGTRRRRSFHTQDLVVATLLRAQRDLPGQGQVSGTSNVRPRTSRLPFTSPSHQSPTAVPLAAPARVSDACVPFVSVFVRAHAYAPQVHLAMKYGIAPIGTIAQYVPVQRTSSIKF